MTAISVVIRTLNEGRYLDELLSGIANQVVPGQSVEVVIVDSGSTDETLQVARRHGCVIRNIAKNDFTFGRSLNMGCDAARGEILVFVSGHCVPASANWLASLTQPLRDGVASYTYGRQAGRDTTKFSESQVFAKYFPPVNDEPEGSFFCNNANASILRSAWEAVKFDEKLTGLEDLRMGKDLLARGHRVAYVPEATVYHIHDESWRQVRLRYEREALALRTIMPEVHLAFSDFLRYLVTGISHDFGAALSQRQLMRRAPEIVMFRLMQYWGAYQGNREHRHISAVKREEYFYPAKARRKKVGEAVGCAVTPEGP